MSIRHQVAGVVRPVIGDTWTRGGGLAIEDAKLLGLYLGSPWGRESARRLLGMRDAYWGERAYIIGNGPSLRDMDLEPLRSEYTFGSNRIYLAFEELGFATTFLCAIADQIVEQFADEIAATPSRVFMRHELARRTDLPRTVTTCLVNNHRRFGTHPLLPGFSSGGTVTYFSMQLAFYLGFREVILIGVDHSFVEVGVPAVETLPQDKYERGPATVVSGGDDPNHFTPGYFGKGVKWVLPDWQQMEASYRLARLTYEAAGRRIVDATVGGKLTVFPKVNYTDTVRM